MNNDRFKFRIFSNIEKRYIQNECFVLNQDGELVEPQSTIYGEVSFTRPTENLTVEQCTGLKDADGKLIYEGDIICGRNPDCRHEIVYDNDNACFRAELLPKPEHWAQNALYSTPRQQWINEFSKRVIGNIHNNPELLQETK